MVNTREEAQKLVAYTHYPPRGARSFGPVRASLYGGPDYAAQANDTVPNFLLMNKGDGTFEEVGISCGVALDQSGSARGAMGIDWGDFSNDEALGLAIGNFANEMTALYVCQTPGMPEPVFRDEAVSNGIGPVTRTELTFGVLFADFDLDSRLDILACNGHLEEDIQKVQSSQHYEQPPQLLWNCGSDYDSEFMVASEDKTGSAFTKRMVGRGAARADIDGDGDIDVLLFSSGGKPRLLRNDQKLGNHWLRFKLTGTKTNKDAKSRHPAWSSAACGNSGSGQWPRRGSHAGWSADPAERVRGIACGATTGRRGPTRFNRRPGRDEPTPPGELAGIQRAHQGGTP